GGTGPTDQAVIAYNENGNFLSPQDARPHWFLESISERNFVTHHTLTHLFPLLTACRNETPYAGELSPFADIETLASYLQAGFSYVTCLETQGATEKSKQWRFQQGSLWIVPV